jgi:hypothetical protein
VCLIIGVGHVRVIYKEVYYDV